MEVPVAPRGVKPSGYPVFAAPRETIEATAEVGFDYCTVASNHSFDQGWPGVVATLDALDEEGIEHAGTEQQRRPNDQQVRVATALARSGVFNLVYGHHAHVPQPWDTIAGVPVVYGGGNLVAQMKVATPRAYEQYLGRITFERKGERFEVVGTEYVPLLMTLGKPGAPARVLDVNKALAEGRGDADRLRVAKDQVAQAVGLLGAEVTEVG